MILESIEVLSKDIGEYLEFREDIGFTSSYSVLIGSI